MHQIYPDAGLVKWLERMADADFHFHLFTNNVTPDRSTVLGGLTEMAIAGYAVVTVNAADFILSGVAGHVGTILAAPIAFLNGSGAPAIAYGYYITDTTDTDLLGVARFDSAPVSKDDGDSWLVTPTLSDFSQFAS